MRTASLYLILLGLVLTSAVGNGQSNQHGNSEKLGTVSRVEDEGQGSTFYSGYDLLKADQPIKFGENVIVDSKGYQEIIGKNGAYQIIAQARGNRSLCYRRQVEESIASDSVFNHKYLLEIYDRKRSKVLCRVDLVETINVVARRDLPTQLGSYVFDSELGNINLIDNDLDPIAEVITIGDISTNDNLYWVHYIKELVTSDNVVTHNKSAFLVFDTLGNIQSKFEHRGITEFTDVTQSGRYFGYSYWKASSNNIMGKPVFGIYDLLHEKMVIEVEDTTKYYNILSVVTTTLQAGKETIRIFARNINHELNIGYYIIEDGLILWKALTDDESIKMGMAYGDDNKIIEMFSDWEQEEWISE